MPWNENGPPYSSFHTTHVYSLSRQSGRWSVAVFYAHALPDAWSIRVTSGSSITFRRGLALLYIVGDQAFQRGRASFELQVDYKGYARDGGH